MGTNGETDSYVLPRAPHVLAKEVLAQQTGLRYLDVGCGPSKAKGAIGMDWVGYPGVDVVHNLEKFPWPFPDQSFDRIRARHVLEHVDAMIPAMDELHRILRPGGVLQIIVPYFGRYSAFRDPTHRRFCTWESFDYFVPGMGKQVYSKNGFRYVRRELVFTSGLFAKLGKLIFRLNRKWYEKHAASVLSARHLEIFLQPIYEISEKQRMGER